MNGSCSGKCWIATGAVLGFLAVFAGAFGAHGLKDTGYLDTKYEGETKTVVGLEVPAAYKYLGDFETGVRYQMYHALAVILLGLFANHRSSKLVTATGWCLATGTVLFSGSLYLLVITKAKWFGAIAPIGGTLQLVGWVMFAIAAIRAGQQPRTGNAS